jgi:hypothetical protein
MNLKQIRTELAVRTAYEQMFCEGVSIALQLAIDEFKAIKDESQMTLRLTAIGMLVHRMNFADKLENERVVFLTAMLFISQEMDWDIIPIEPMQQALAMDSVIDVSVGLGRAASNRSEEYVLRMFCGDYLAAGWVEMDGVRYGVAPVVGPSVNRVQTGRESMAFPHKPAVHVPTSTVH